MSQNACYVRPETENRNRLEVAPCRIDKWRVWFQQLASEGERLPGLHELMDSEKQPAHVL